MFEYSIQKPVSRFFQSNLYVLIDFDFNHYDYDKSPFISAITDGKFNPNATLAYKFGYYPNSRTNINLSASLQYGFYKNSIILIGGESYDRSNILPRIQLQTSYFVNSRFRLFASLEALYSRNIKVKNSYPGDPFSSYVPDDYSVQISEWYIGGGGDQISRNLNGLAIYPINNKVSYTFNAGFAFNIY